MTREPAAEPRPLLEPADGLPPVTTTDAQLEVAAERLAAGVGPVAVDTERASGYRYSQRAYLVQLRREGSGTVLVDPVPFADLRLLQDAISDAEWVLHAASQDLPCLTELGLRPRRLFDTELAARLAGYERVGLATIVEALLGYSLVKGHSAVDWSTRPLPEDWLRYAALDVELLVDLRDVLEAELRRQGKLAWAEQEFAALVRTEPKPPLAEPWRRTSGIHRARTRRQLAAVRALWQARDAIARRRDIAPGRVLPDSAIIAAVLANPASPEALARLPVFSGPRMRRGVRTWFEALAKAARLPDSALPTPLGSSGNGGAAGDGAGAVPGTNRWSDRDPNAAARLSAARTALGELAEQHRMPVENVLEPALVRRLAWTPPAAADGEPLDEDTVAGALRAGGARPWQVELTAGVLTEALNVA